MLQFLKNPRVPALCCISFAAIGLYLSLGTFFTEYAALQTDSFNPKTETIPEELPQRERLKLLLADTGKLSDRLPSSHRYRGDLTSRLARTEPEAGQSISLLCQALHHFQNAISLSPANAKNHLHWARTAASLGNSERCALESALVPTAIAFRNPDASTAELVRARLDWARSLEPFNTASLYLAAIANIRLGERKEAISHLREIERLNPVFSPEQKEFFYRLVERKEDLELAVPRQYPEILNWILYFSDNRPKEYLAWEAVFAEAFTDALKALDNKLQTEPATLARLPRHFRTSDRLPIVSRFDHLRQQLDRVLARIYGKENNRRWAKFLDTRAGLQRIPIVKSYLRKDILPRETMLSNWQSDQSQRVVQLNRLNTSIGYYVPEEYSPKLIVIRNASRRLDRTDSSIEIRTSMDNEQFEIFRTADTIEHFTVDTRETLVLPAPANTQRFVKIRYDSQGNDSSFKNRFAQLLEVYGEKIQP